MTKLSKDQRFHSYLSPVAAKEYWNVRMLKDVSPEAALLEAVANLESKIISEPDLNVMDMQGNVIGHASP